MTAEQTALIRLTGQETTDHSVPAEVLIRALKGVQETVYVLGAAHEHQPVSGRFRPSADLRQRYQLWCGISREGSYSVPVAVGTPSRQLPLIPDGHTVLDALDGLIHAVASSDDRALSDLLPDSRLRNLALRKLESALPRSGEQWRFGFSKNGGGEVMFDSQKARAIAPLLHTVEEPDTVMVVIGELIQIDFARYRLVLRYPPTKRALECTYLPDIEDMLIDNRRDYIQVTGTYTLDEEGNPSSLTDVTRIEQVDLSPLFFDSIRYGGRQLILGPPLVIHPSLDEETQQLYTATDSDLDLHAFAYTREDLVDEINEQLLFLWQTYALEDPARLTEGARRLRQSLRSRMREVA